MSGNHHDRDYSNAVRRLALTIAQFISSGLEETVGINAKVNGICPFCLERAVLNELIAANVSAHWSPKGAEQAAKDATEEMSGAIKDHFIARAAADLEENPLASADSPSTSQH